MNEQAKQGMLAGLDLAARIAEIERQQKAARLLAFATNPRKRKG